LRNWHRLEQAISLIDELHASAAWPTNSIIGSTPETLRKRTREERSMDVPEEIAEAAVVGGPKLYGTSRGDFFKML
jgi:dihydroxyacetone kinase